MSIGIGTVIMKIRKLTRNILPVSLAAVCIFLDKIGMLAKWNIFSEYEQKQIMVDYLHIFLHRTPLRQNTKNQESVPIFLVHKNSKLLKACCFWFALLLNVQYYTFMRKSLIEKSNKCHWAFYRAPNDFDSIFFKKYISLFKTLQHIKRYT